METAQEWMGRIYPSMEWLDNAVKLEAPAAARWTTTRSGPRSPQAVAHQPTRTNNPDEYETTELWGDL